MNHRDALDAPRNRKGFTTIADLVPIVGGRDSSPHGSTLRTLRLFEDADCLFGNSVGRYYGGTLSPGEVAWLLRPQPGDPKA